LKTKIDYLKAAIEDMEKERDMVETKEE